MASQTRTVGDTFPPIRGAAIDEDKLLSLPDADAVELVAVGTGLTPFGGDIEVIDPPEDVGDKASALGFNWRYNLEAGDLDAAGTVTPWLKITWDATTTPPEIEWVKGGDTINVQAAPE